MLGRDVEALFPLLGDLEEALGDFVEGVEAGGVGFGSPGARVVEDHGFFAVAASGVEGLSGEGELIVDRRSGCGFAVGSDDVEPFVSVLGRNPHA
ncbi:hypothetical protein [Streptomyces lonegramiae]|uniref:Uncharacterized protein n=1 Tax=Streptomyces lonegramiae TaxID=3075524 RepID=A0ABU2XQP1_9ACTN|nr:hypothetical protein [Streptomyces sp. DSM 41529]MDT0547769.1 hypothetical protein [Streptomyces sp. DSM 41529]